VKVEIKYVIELRHDFEVDGLRFTSPTSVASRYGAVPAVGEGTKISVEVNIPSNVTLVQVCKVQLPP
jgi:hypothetical protein